MMTFKSFFQKKYIGRTIVTILFVITLLFSVITYLATKKTVRRIFIFPSADTGSYVVEYRNLAKKPIQGDVQLYIDEILLGSTIERTKLLFTSGTTVLSCFQRGNTLYLNLSPDLLEIGEGVIEIKQGVDLLKENILKNFKKIDSIEIYVNSKLAFEN